MQDEGRTTNINVTAVVAVLIAFLGLLGATFTWFHSEFKSLGALQAREELSQPWLDRWLKVQDDRRDARSERVDRLEKRVERLESFHFKE